jgi:hypothetical protein
MSQEIDFLADTTVSPRFVSQPVQTDDFAGALAGHCYRCRIPCSTFSKSSLFLKVQPQMNHPKPWL